MPSSALNPPRSLAPRLVVLFFHNLVWPVLPRASQPLDCLFYSFATWRLPPCSCETMPQRPLDVGFLISAISTLVAVRLECCRTFPYLDSSFPIEECRGKFPLGSRPLCGGRRRRRYVGLDGLPTAHAPEIDAADGLKAIRISGYRAVSRR